MNSFGMWYQLSSDNNNKKVSSCSDTSEKPKIDLHVNFWSLEDITIDGKIKEPYLDIGIKIKNHMHLEQLVFYCPFRCEQSNIKDLAECVSKKNNANIIFNDDCEMETKDNYTIVQLSDNERLLIFPISSVIKKACIIENEDESTKIIFKFNEFHKYIENVEKLNDLKLLYIRFRIQNVALRDIMYFDSEPLNKSFESAFSGTRIIDFKVNEKRNIPEFIRTENIVTNATWAVFDTIHFLAMMPSSYNLTPLCEENMTCRELEKKLWDDYLGTSIDFSKRHVLAYHWKKKCKEKKIDAFSCLVKVDYSKTKRLTIISYALSVVALGIFSSIIANQIQGMNIICQPLVPTLMITVAIFLGLKK